MKYLSKLNIRVLLSLSLMCAVIFSLPSCTDDVVVSDSGVDSTPGYITFRCNDMVEVYRDNNAATRADLSKNEDEKRIQTLHVFFFDQTSGDLLETSSYTNFPAYQKVSDAYLLKVPTGVADIFGSKEQDKKVHIVAIANIDATDACTDSKDDANKFFTKQYSPEGEIRECGREAVGEKWEIKNIKDLRKWVYYPRVRMDQGAPNDISRLPKAGMPMIGEKDVDLSTKPSGDQYIVDMEALMAKVNVSVSLEPKQFTRDYPILKITEYGVKNMPLAVPFNPCTGEVKEGKSSVVPTSYLEYINTYDVTDAPMYHNDHSGCPEDREFNPADQNFAADIHEYTTTSGLPVTINKDSKPATFSYYTYENIQLPNYASERPNGVNENTPAFEKNGDIFNFKRPSGLNKDEYLPRWKPTIAYENCASALILKGEYTTDQGLTYKAQFTVYIGGDTDAVTKATPGYDIASDSEANYRNFKVKRNHLYTNNIVIRGLDYVRNSSDRVYTFDGRVNVVYENPLYLSIINERLVDAHATALPMDIWITNTDEARVENLNFKIRNSQTKEGNWIRMEYVDAKTMEDGREVTDKDGNKRIVAFAPGTGERPYFTYDLLTSELNKPENYNISVDSEKGNRSRIYFYIDQNVPETNDADVKGTYGPRTATIDITYDVVYSDGSETDHYTQTLDIDQAALVKVSGNHSSGHDVPVTWMEFYEEYLEHSDPLDRHEQIGELYEGLHWGLKGIKVDHNNYDGEGSGRGTHQIYYKTNAFKMTQWAIDKVESRDKVTMSSVRLFNDIAPVSAFHYCYGKNKRNADGTVWLATSTRGWYMPGIRELELALINYYETFTDFQKNFYWSCAPHCTTGLFASKDPNYQYARATKVELGTKDLYISSNTLGQGGSKPREGEGSYLRIRAFYRVD